MPSRPTAPAPISQRSFFTRSKLRSTSPSAKNRHTPSKMASSCFGRLPGALEAVTANDNVER